LIITNISSQKSEYIELSEEDLIKQMKKYKIKQVIDDFVGAFIKIDCP
jgi:hypothetical protein